MYLCITFKYTGKNDFMNIDKQILDDLTAQAKTS